MAPDFKGRQQLTNQEIVNSLKYMGGEYYLVALKWLDKRTGQTTATDMTLPSDLQQLKIHWLAFDDDDRPIVKLLLQRLYLEKFTKLLRKWNRTEGPGRFEVDVKPIEIPEAAAFFESATHKQNELIASILKRNKTPKL